MELAPVALWTNVLGIAEMSGRAKISAPFLSTGVTISKARQSGKEAPAPLRKY